MKLTILKFEYDDDRGEFCGVKIPKSFECEDNLMQADVINDVINFLEENENIKNLINRLRELGIEKMNKFYNETIPNSNHVNL